VRDERVGVARPHEELPLLPGEQPLEVTGLAGDLLAQRRQVGGDVDPEHRGIEVSQLDQRDQRRRATRGRR
jgi:hypothetical protein